MHSRFESRAGSHTFLVIKYISRLSFCFSYAEFMHGKPKRLQYNLENGTVLWCMNLASEDRCGKLHIRQ